MTCVRAFRDLPEEWVGELVRDAHSRFAPVTHGTVADYIPVLAEADPDLFGLSLVEVDGTVHDAGDTVATFSIQSISKAFVLALVCDAIGHEEVHRIVGVNNTGLPFNSVIALELNDGSPMNPMVNAGAIATTALMPGDTAEEKWWAVREGLSRFAGRSLELDERVLRSESASNHRNQGISDLLTSYGRLQGRSEEMVDVYTRQCSLLVTADDLAIMGATLADGGLNPITREQVVSPRSAATPCRCSPRAGCTSSPASGCSRSVCPRSPGSPAASSRSAPGKGALGAFSPPLDRAGNSVRGQRACSYLSRALGLNLFASRPRPAKEGDHDA